MKPVRLPAAATRALPRLALFALCLLYILPGLVGRDPWKNDDASSFGIMWTMANGGLSDWLAPHIVGLPMTEEGPLAFWIGALFIKLFGWLVGDAMAARLAAVGFFLVGALALWFTTFLLGRRADAQPLKLAFGGQPEPADFGRMLADGALLIYVGCLGLLVHSHSTTAEALQVSLVAVALYAAACLFESHSWRSAAGFGLTLGLLALTRGWPVPLALWLGVAMLAGARERVLVPRLLLAAPVALAVTAAWVWTAQAMQPFGASPIDPWQQWNLEQFGGPTLGSLKYFFRNGVWFAWPAWPFAAWAVYAWRRQHDALHITLPLTFFAVLAVLALVNPHGEEALLMVLLPMLAILAAFGLPTMKRGAINAVDWFSVMTLTTCAGFIWIGWIAKQTGWPAHIAKNAFKLAPGFKPEFDVVAVAIALLASGGWIWLVHWRVSRRPAVLWRAVVLSSGGVILCWLLLMTLWLPWGNYVKSYAGVAQQVSAQLPKNHNCVSTDAGAPQRASLAFFGGIPFARFGATGCDFLLLQDSDRKVDKVKRVTRDDGTWQLVWQGRRPSDRVERFRLYKRVN